jgi:hypothetical protein
MPRIVLPSTPVGIGRETIAKILLRPDLVESRRRPSSGTRIHREHLLVAERDVARRLELSLNRGLAIPPPYGLWLAHSYTASVRFLGST